MNNEWLRIFGVGALLLGLPILCVLGLLGIINPWRFRLQLPTPPEAMQLKTEYFRDYTSVADGTQRETQFEIDQPEEVVRAFYQTELTKRGWIYQGAVRPECGAHLRAPTTVVDVYHGGGRTLTVRIVIPDATRSRQVHVTEYQGKLGHPVQHTPVLSADTHAAVVGDWQAIGESVDRPFMLCFYEQGGLSLLLTERYAISGKYQWVDEGIQMSFDTSRIVGSTGPRRDGDDELCNDVPALFSGGCQAKRVNPASYPGPDGIMSSTPTSGPPSDVPPYPAPTPPITEFIHIDSVFAVSIERDKLTLSNRLGNSETFQRVIEE